MKVVITGLIYPFTMLHFFWRAFERRKNVELFVAGPYTDDWIPWSGGIQLPKKYVKMPNFPLPPNIRNIPSTIVEGQLPWKPDLWLQIDAGFHFTNKPDAGIVAHIQTDPHVLKGSYAIPKAYSDFNFCMQTPYMDDGDIYLPYGYDPDIHYPIHSIKEYDACLIGLHYETRDALVSALRSNGMNVYYSIGEVYDQYRTKYNQSKIALSWSSLKDLPARIWEALAMQLPLVTNRVPDLPTFFVEEEHYLGFDTLDEAVMQVQRLMVDEELRHSIADAGYNKVKPHSWDNRVEQLLQTVKLA